MPRFKGQPASGNPRFKGEPVDENLLIAGASGFNRGIGKVAGLPVDLVNAGIGMVAPQYHSQTPVLGSQWNLEQLERLKQVYNSQTKAGQVVQRVGEEVGASALPVGGMMRYAPSIAGTRFAPLVNEMMAAPGRALAMEGLTAAASGGGAVVANEIAPGNKTAEMIGQITPSIGIGLVENAVRRLMRGSNATGVQSTIDTFNQAGATPTAGQATDTPWVQGFENVLANSPGSYGKIRKAAQATADALQQKVNLLADDLSTNTSAEFAGRTIEKGLTQGFVNRFKVKAKALYDAINIQPDTPITVSKTQTTLNELAAPIKGAENVSGVLQNPKIRRIYEAFSVDAKNGTLPYRALKELRSEIGEALSSFELVSDLPKAKLKQLYAALSMDMEAAAKASGLETFRAYKRANKFYSAGMSRIDDVLTKIVKKANPEDIYLAATKGKEGATTIRAIRKSLEPGEWDIVAATTLRRFGRAKPSQQDALGEAFSVETFLTNWNSLSREAQEALFAGSRYEGLRHNLAALIKSMSKIRESSKVLLNPSGTAGQTANISAFAAGGTGLITGNTEIPITIAALAASGNVAAHLMTSPKFVAWLAKSTEIPVQRLPAHITRLVNTMNDAEPVEQMAAHDYLWLLRGGENGNNQD